MAEVPEVKLVADFAAADDFTKKHTPFMTVDGSMDRFIVTIEVGHEVPHPNEEGHYITYIELYAGECSIAQFYFTPGLTYPKVCVPVALPAGTVLRAVEHCNLHGWWASEITLPSAVV